LEECEVTVGKNVLTHKQTHTDTHSHSHRHTLTHTHTETHSHRHTDKLSFQWHIELDQYTVQHNAHVCQERFSLNLYKSFFTASI